MKIFIVIPAYNEEKRIKKVILNIKKAGYKNIIVADDGSRDNTAFIARENGAIVAQHIINRGAGAATATGIKTALKLNADIILTIDGDGQHDINDIPKLIAPIIKKEAEVALGVRTIKRKDMPVIRRISNFFGNLLTAIFFGLWVSDSQSGFKAFSKKAAKKIEIKTDGYEFCSEIIREIKRNKLTFKEIPTKVHYSEYSLEKGQNFAKGLNTAFKIILRNFMR